VSCAVLRLLQRLMQRRGGAAGGAGDRTAHNRDGDRFERLTDWQLVVDTEQLKRHLLPHLWWDWSDRVAGSGDGGQPSQP